MGSPTDLGAFTNVTSLGTSPTIYNYAGVDITWTKPCRYLRAATAGNITFKDADNVSKTGAWAAGETRAVANLGIVAATTTATGIEGMV